MVQKTLFDSKPEPSRPTNWVGRAMDIWTDSTGGVIAGGRMGRALKPLVMRLKKTCHFDTDEEAWRFAVEPMFVRYLKHTDQRYATPEGFARAPGQCGVPETTREALARGEDEP
jgi:hypothetical protein